jgi:hypothetical protein
VFAPAGVFALVLGFFRLRARQLMAPGIRWQRCGAGEI